MSGSIGSFFGRGIKKTYRQGLLVGSENAEEHSRVVDLSQDYLVCHCGRTFDHPPAFLVHKRFCGLAMVAEEHGMDSPGLASNSSQSLPESDAHSDSEASTTSVASSKKLRKSDGKPQLTGMKTGSNKTPYTLMYKYTVATAMVAAMDLKEREIVTDPLARVSEQFCNLATSNIWNWWKQHDQLKDALTHGMQLGARNLKHRKGKLVDLQSKTAHKLTLHGGKRGGIYPAMEHELHKLYRGHRAKGLRVNNRWCVINMRKLIRTHLGDEPADKFKGSYGWLWRFARRFGVSLRRINNHKHQHVSVRLPRIKRWHARLRRRLSKGHNLDPVWGRWLPKNRLSIDQVPCNLREGSKCTYEDKGASRVWLAGCKQDDGKRFCTLQIIARGENGDPSLPRRGQPKIGVIFRGQGKRISNEEKASWHPDVHVRFQPKAWADTDYCEAHAGFEMVEATRDARSRNEQSVAFFDNLHGQTTVEHEKFLLLKARCVRHLLPGGVTAEIQLIDDGVGYAVKSEMGQALDRWLEEDDNLDLWTGEGENVMPMWKKRVLITQLLATAWETVCERFDFTKAATRIGMRLTMDGSGDDDIKIQGVDEYTFLDADGGDANITGDGACPDELAAENQLVEEGEVEVEGEGEGESEDEGEGEDSSDEEDDTAEDGTVRDRVGPAPEVPSPGFVYLPEMPDIRTDSKALELVGSYILHAWATPEVNGWFMGKISARGCSVTDMRKTPGVNFVVTYTRALTKTSALVGRVASTLTAARYGPKEWWILLAEQEE